jgi:hypothetical protein
MMLILKVLLKLSSIWGPAVFPWLAALVFAESTGKIHTLAHTSLGGVNRGRKILRRGRPRATDIITALSEQLLDLQCQLRDFQQNLAALADQVRENEQPRQKTEAA